MPSIHPFVGEVEALRAGMALLLDVVTHASSLGRLLWDVKRTTNVSDCVSYSCVRCYV